MATLTIQLALETAAPRATAPATLRHRAAPSTLAFTPQFQRQSLTGVCFSSKELQRDAH